MGYMTIIINGIIYNMIINYVLSGSSIKNRVNIVYYYKYVYVYRYKIYNEIW